MSVPSLPGDPGDIPGSEITVLLLDLPGPTTRSSNFFLSSVSPTVDTCRRIRNLPSQRLPVQDSAPDPR